MAEALAGAAWVTRVTITLALSVSSGSRSPRRGCQSFGQRRQQACKRSKFLSVSLDGTFIWGAMRLNMKGAMLEGGESSTVLTGGE